MKKSFLCLLLVFILTGCGGNFDIIHDDDEITYQETLFIIGYNFEGTNPLLVKNDTNREIFSLIYDSLYDISKDFSPKEGLSENLSMTTADGLNYRIDLKENVLFHDGTRLTASDVVATINYLLSNSTAYDYNVKKISGVSVNDEYSVNVTLRETAPNLKALLTFPIVNSKDILKEFSFNGTGMYKVESHVEKKHIDLAINEGYYEKPPKEIKKIRVQLMPDRETANYAYSSGMSDVFSQDIFTDTGSLNPKSGVEAKEYLSTNYSFLLLNNQKDVFKNYNVRRAIDAAIDKDSIVSDVLFSHGKAVYTPVFEGAWCYNENIKPSFNVEEAKLILKKEGFSPDHNTGILEKEWEDDFKLSFDILVNNDNNFRIQVANKISENLKYIGIDCRVKIVSFEEYAQAYYDKSYEAFLGTVPMSYDFDLKMFMGEGNVGEYKNSSAVEILNALGKTDDVEKKKEYYKELQKIFYYDIPHVSLYYTKESAQSSSKIKSGLDPTGISIFNGIENWSFK